MDTKGRHPRTSYRNLPESSTYTSNLGLSARISDLLLLGVVCNHWLIGTPGLTGQQRTRVHLNFFCWYLDVVLSPPPGVGPRKGAVVRRLMRYVRWVQNAVKQFSFYLPLCVLYPALMFAVREEPQASLSLVEQRGLLLLYFKVRE